MTRAETLKALAGCLEYKQMHIMSLAERPADDIIVYAPRNFVEIINSLVMLTFQEN